MSSNHHAKQVIVNVHEGHPCPFVISQFAIRGGELWPVSSWGLIGNINVNTWIGCPIGGEIGPSELPWKY